MSAFSDLYEPLRTCLGDVGSVALYTTAQLDLGLAYGLLNDATYSEGALVGGARAVSPDVANKTDELRLVLRGAIALLSPSRNLQRYGTRTLTVTRDTGAGSYVAMLEGKLRDIVDGRFVVDSDTEWDVFLRGTADAAAELASFPG